MPIALPRYAAFAVLLASSTAHAAPTYCSTDGVRGISATYEAAIGDDPWRALPGLVAAACNPDAEAAKNQDKLAAARARWNKELGLSDADWGDVAAWSVLGNGVRSTSLKYDAKIAPSKQDPISQFILLQGHDDLTYAADALGDKLSELGRFGFALSCTDSRKIVDWAVCQPDIDAIDPAKMLAEIRADTKHTGVERIQMRIVIRDSKQKLADHAAKVKTETAKDDAYDKMFELSRAARTAWSAKPPDATLLALVAAMDDARVTGSKKAFDGCDDTTWAALKKAVSAIPAKKFAGLKDEPGNEFIQGAVGVIVNDRDGYLAAAARYLCQADKPDVLSRFLGGAMLHWPGYRGPRSAAFTAILTAGLELDTRGAQIDWPRVARTWFGGSESFSGGGRGIVAKVKANGATSVVEFQKKMHKSTVCSDWKDSNRISMISSSGTIYYEYTCLKYKTEMINIAPTPATVNSKYAAGLKPGMQTSIIEDVVTGAWKKAGAPPSAVFGIPTK